MRFIALVFSLMFCCRPAISAARTTIESMQERMASIVTITGRKIVPSAGRMMTRDSQGAGVVLDSRGRIVTNTHIIYDSQFILVTLKDGKEQPARVLLISPDSDFSILEIKPEMPLLPVEWSAHPPALGDPVTTIGHSNLLNGTISGGIVSGLGTRDTPQGRNIELMRLNINHYSGDSGGPVFNSSAQFLGLISSKKLSADKELFVIPSDKILSAYATLPSQ